jgi:hypothetical protein
MRFTGTGSIHARAHRILISKTNHCHRSTLVRQTTNRPVYHANVLKLMPRPSIVKSAYGKGALMLEEEREKTQILLFKH